MGMGHTMWPDGQVGEVLQEVFRERQRQEDLKAKGKFLWTCASKTHPGGREISSAEKLAVLAEEFGEIGREVTEELIAQDKFVQAHLERVKQGDIPAFDPDDVKVSREWLRTKKIREELVQLAAVAVAWAESLS